MPALDQYALVPAMPELTWVDELSEPDVRVLLDLRSDLARLVAGTPETGPTLVRAAMPCGSAFYDRSKNNSGVWHDVRVCGNAVNLRASRA